MCFADSHRLGDEVPETSGALPQRNRASGVERAGCGARDVRTALRFLHLILGSCGSGIALTVAVPHRDTSYEEFVVEGDGIEAAQDEEGEMRGLEMLVMLLLDFVQCLLSKVSLSLA
jgi:hypothetical protein